MGSILWQCPYCNRYVTLVNENVEKNINYFNNGNKNGWIALVTQVFVCPNPKCCEYALKVYLYQTEVDILGQYSIKKDQILGSWDLKPQSSAKIFPNYIPKPILDDYKEACSIKKLSPKASATLSRRCLQGMIRDFWKIQKNRLIDEINELEKKIDSLTWNAIDGVRKIGNIGAHMEKDINIITDVDENEAELLITLIENLLKDWYIAKHDQEERYKKIIHISKNK